MSPPFSSRSWLRTAATASPVIQKAAPPIRPTPMKPRSRQPQQPVSVQNKGPRPFLGDGSASPATGAGGGGGPGRAGAGGRGGGAAGRGGGPDGRGGTAGGAAGRGGMGGGPAAGGAGRGIGGGAAGGAGRGTGGDAADGGTGRGGAAGGEGGGAGRGGGIGVGAMTVTSGPVVRIVVAESSLSISTLYAMAPKRSSCPLCSGDSATR